MYCLWHHVLVSALSPPRQVAWAILPAWLRRANLAFLKGSSSPGRVVSDIWSSLWINGVGGHHVFFRIWSRCSKNVHVPMCQLPYLIPAERVSQSWNDLAGFATLSCKMPRESKMLSLFQMGAPKAVTWIFLSTYICAYIIYHVYVINYVSIPRSS